MSEQEPNLPDDFWRKAFDDAAETPPTRVWDAIERQLDESNGPRILPLWGTGLASSRPLAWGAGIAAAIALLLVGWWAIRTTSSVDSTVARVQQLRQTAPTNGSANALIPDREKLAKPGLPEPEPETVAATAQSSSVQSKKQNRRRSLPDDSQPRLSVTEQPAAPLPVDLVNNARLQSDESRREAAIAHRGTISAQRTTTLAARQQTQQTISTAPMQLPTTTFVDFGPEQRSEQAPNLLAAHPVRLRELGQIQRIVWIRPGELPSESNTVEPKMAEAKRQPKEVWASVSLMPGSFNPSVAVRSTQPSFSNVYALNSAKTNQASVDSRSSFSVAYQASAGIQLTDHWSIESGVGYLLAHSTVASPSRSAVMMTQSSVSNQDVVFASSLFTDALINSVSNSTGHKAAAGLVTADNVAFRSQTNYSAQTIQTLINNYEYVQVPIQVGYQLRPRRRLSLSLLGGLLTNIFVRNTVGDELVIAAQDGVYRPVSLAATMGARFRYRPSRRWSASLAGVYQPSLGLGTRPESEVTSRPTSTGMSFGFDYHF